MTAPFIDSATAVRAGEELDAAPLLAYLREHLPGLARDTPLMVEQFPSGFSNLTYLLRAGEREWVLRRPPFGANIKGGHDMAREYRLLSALHPTYHKVPRPLAYCDDNAVLGAPFYVMERVRGVIFRNRPPKGVTPIPELMRGISTALVDTLIELHQLDVNAAGLSDLGQPEGYVARQVQGWARRYENARTDDLPAMEQAAQWLIAHPPTESGAALVHNDFKYDNVVLDPADLTRPIAVLDWEMATLGDPLMDLGTTLGYWAEPDDPLELRQFNVTHLPGNLTRQQVAARYAERTGRDVSNIAFYYVFGLFKIGVILQQIYARYKQGLTHDERFGRLIILEQVVAAMAVKAIERGRL